MKGNVIRKLVVGSAAVAGVFFMAQAASGAITGRCDNCHTMHNSQDGIPMTSTAGGGTTANEYLLLLNCTNCHSRIDGQSAINAATLAPAVQHTTTEPGASPGSDYFNAGGSFYWVSNTPGDAYGHNVDEVTTADIALGNVPPGDSLGDYNPAAQISCVDTSGGGAAGVTGCHYGGGHHTNTGGDYSTPATTTFVDGLSVGSSFRFLSGGTLGGENGNWEWNNGAQDHNIYAGDSAIGGTAGTITSVCIRCHGDFHGSYTGDLGTGTGPASPWYRHPTDLGLTDGSVDSEHASYGSYDPTVPIAADFGSIPTTGDATMTNWRQLNSTAGYEMVTCVSCHRAHGSANPDMLRWSYADMVAGNAGTAAGTGCFKCHSAKD